MAKKGSKPAKKKAEPAPKKVAAKKVVKKVENVEKTTPAPEVEATIKVKKTREFPDCTHENTRRTMGQRNRVMHVCSDCGKVVKMGSR